MKEMQSAEPEQSKSARAGPGDHSEMLAFIESDNTALAEQPKTQAQSNRNTVAMSLMNMAKEIEPSLMHENAAAPKMISDFKI